MGAEILQSVVKLSVLCMILLMGAFHPVAVMADCFLSYCFWDL
ncbi:hypothetical protein ECDEC3C_1641, partial [Escherichia coli DEC3C]